MKPLALVVTLLTSLPALAGGLACQVADSSIETPGLRDLVGPGATAPKEIRLTTAQIEKLAALDTDIYRKKKAIEKELAALAKGKHPEPQNKSLTDLVTFATFLAVRDRAIVIDVETSDLFMWTRRQPYMNVGKAEACPVCVAVRDAVVKPFGFVKGEYEGAEEIAAHLQGLRETWVKELKAVLTQPQLDHLIAKQESWLKKVVASAVTESLKVESATFCASCSEQPIAAKCEFCIIVVQAVREAAKE